MVFIYSKDHDVPLQTIWKQPISTGQPRQQLTDKLKLQSGQPQSFAVANRSTLALTEGITDWCQ